MIHVVYIYYFSALFVSVISFLLSFVNSSMVLWHCDIFILNHCYIFGPLNVYHGFNYIHKHKINALFLFKSMHFHLDYAF